MWCSVLAGNEGWKPPMTGVGTDNQNGGGGNSDGSGGSASGGGTIGGNTSGERILAVPVVGQKRLVSGARNCWCQELGIFWSSEPFGHGWRKSVEAFLCCESWRKFSRRKFLQRRLLRFLRRKFLRFLRRKFFWFSAVSVRCRLFFLLASWPRVDEHALCCQ